MAQDNKHLEVVLDTQVESVNLAEEMCLRVAEAAGFDEEMCYRIGMSVREGVINAFHYGNQERPDKKIHLAVDLTPEKLVIHVMDEGKGFKLTDVPDPLAEENILSTSGRGIFLMRAFMDEFDVVPGATGGAEIVMSKWLPGAENGHAMASRRIGQRYGSAERSLSECMALHATYRDSGVVTVVDLGGRIVLGDGSALLRKTVRRVAGRQSHENSDQSGGRELHRQFRDRRTGACLHFGENARRGAEAAASDQEGSRHAADHQALYSI